MVEDIKIAVLVSGEGTNMVKMYEACQERRVKGSIVLVVSDRDCIAIKKAKELGLVTAIIPWCRDRDSREVWGSLLLYELGFAAVDLICLAGFMLILPVNVVNFFSQRILNIHPGRLPQYAGKDPQARLLKRFEMRSSLMTILTGNTVHIVTEHVDDSSSILAMDRVIAYREDTVDTLSKRLRDSGYDTYIEAINLWYARYYKALINRE